MTTPFPEPGQEEQVPAFGSRRESFQTGAGTTPRAPESLQADQQRDAAEDPDEQGFRPNGVNMQLIASGDGNSDKDQERRLMGGGYLAAQNGISATSYQQTRPFMSTSLNGGPTA
jgi:hypothetical protein